MTKMNYGKRFNSPHQRASVPFIPHQGSIPPWAIGMTPKQKAFALAKATAATKQSSERVGKLPNSIDRWKVTKEPRVEAEERLIKTVEAAIEAIGFQLHELVQIPNPTAKFANKIDQKTMIDLLRRMANCVRPPLKIEHFDISIAQPKVALTRVCVSCGGPAATEFRGELFCDDCVPGR
jgi:hypothetical protein